LVLSRSTASVTVAGDYRVAHAPDRNIRTAIRGAWSFTDAAFTARVAEIIAGHRQFWGDPSTPYLVTVTHLDLPQPGWLSIGGTGLDDAFAFFATPNAELSRITRTLAHESLHTWIPARIGGMPDGEEEAAGYWLSEGFTDFYTGRLLVREGIWTPAEFADDLNDMLAAYARTPFRAEPNSRVIADFWHNDEIQHLPYQRGRLLATIWDARLRAAGDRDLTDVVKLMRRRAETGDTLHAAQLFPIAAAAYHLDVADDIAAHVDRGELIALPEDVFAPCGRVVTVERANFHRGFDIEATNANNHIIAGVVRDGPAYAAGMRDGMVLVRRDAGEIGDAEQEIAYVVRDGETERTFRYMPRGRGNYTLQQLHIAEGLGGEQLAQCLRVLGGN
jgi:predicted metalloprotease with PDZ domain